jgi:hypothetical protein
MSLNVRRKFLVDRRLQLAVAIRSVVYWCFCVVSIACWILCWWMMSRPELMLQGAATSLWYEFGPPLVASLLLLPIVVIDAIRLSNRMAGPMYRLRRAMHQLAEGEPVAPLSVRKNDWWRDAVEDFNRIAERMNESPTSTPDAPSRQLPPRDEDEDEIRDIDAELEHALAE